MNNALPPGVNHKSASDQLASTTQNTATAAMVRQTASLPAGTRAQAKVELQVKTARIATAKV